MEKKTRLGRGLDALLTSQPESETTTQTPTEVRVDVIEHNPYQPRKRFDDDELSSLTESIRTHGVLQPLVVRQVDGRIQLVAGERRLRAARSAGLASVPVRIVDFNDQQLVEAALVENIQRTDLNPIEKAQGFKDYLDRFHMTHEQLAARLGLGRATITNLVTLLDLHREVQDLVRNGQLSTGHAKILKGVSDLDKQLTLAREIVARGMSVRDTETQLKQMQYAPAAEDDAGSSESSSRSAPQKTTHVEGIENELRQKLGLRIEIKVKGKDKGQIVLGFESNDDFERLVEVLRR
jgi:ParB family transcriptional regulator, chromosome partitioning protein